MENIEKSFIENYVDSAMPQILDFAIDVIFALVVFLVAYTGIKWLVIEWKDSLAWLWTAIGIFLSGIFCTFVLVKKIMHLFQGKTGI